MKKRSPRTAKKKIKYGESIDSNVGRANSVAYAASKVLKNGPGALTFLNVYNSKGSTQFIQLHDAAALPADTAIPVLVFELATVASKQISFGRDGLRFTTGIVVCNSSTGPTLTIGSADIYATGAVR